MVSSKVYYGMQIFLTLKIFFDNKALDFRDTAQVATVHSRSYQKKQQSKNVERISRIVKKVQNGLRKKFHQEHYVNSFSQHRKINGYSDVDREPNWVEIYAK